ncbi:MAG: DEAD/DEAH box helicase [Acidobacteriota bacterium]
MSAPSFDSLQPFDPLVRAWFEDSFESPTEIQHLAWPRIAEGGHVLLTAPTGSGKTLTAFLWALNRLLTGEWERGRPRVLYISPLKALNYDIQRNLQQPLEELSQRFEVAGRGAAVRVATRSGDTTPAQRRRMLTHPPEILITTPESLNILLTSQGGRKLLTGLETVILDEIHAVASTKRGTHLFSAVERLTLHTGEVQRIGLSATVQPLEKVAELLGGYELTGDLREPVYQPRPVAVLRSTGARRYHVQVTFPPELAHDADDAAAGGGEAGGIEQEEAVPGSTGSLTRDLERQRTEGRSSEDAYWPAMARLLRERILENRSTLIFANSRRMTEKVSRYINEGQPRDLAYSHHGSLSREIRQVVERRLKDGELDAIVATNSLELGIDIGDLDEVVLLQAPPTVSSAVQRIGRSGHGVGEESRARLVPTHGRDFLDMAVMVPAVLEQDIEAVRPVEAPLDVLAQILLSMVAHEAWDLDRLFHTVRCSWPYRHLPRRSFDLVLEMLAGRYAEVRVRELEPRVRIDAVAGTVRGRQGAARWLYLSGGTIPDRGYFALRLADSRSKLGELDEEFVWERSVGDSFSLGNQSWRITQITHNDVLVVPARGSAPMAPFWRADERDRDAHLSQRRADFLEDADRRLGSESFLEELQSRHHMAPTAAQELVSYLHRQREITGCGLPHRHRLVVEHYRDAYDGTSRRQLLIHTLWGGQVNRPFAIALAAAWEEARGTPVEIVQDDDCINLVSDEEVSAEEIFQLVAPQQLESLLRQRLERTGFFGARFRTNAARALLLPRAGFRGRTPLWLSRLKAKKLLDSVGTYEDFPILLETWRTCLKDELDLPTLRRHLEEVASGLVAVEEVWTRQPSPFAANLVWKETNRLMYEDDTPEGGMRSSLTDELLQELVFSSRLRPLIDPALARELEDKLQRLAQGYAPTEVSELVALVEERLLIPPVEWGRLLAAVERDLELEEGNRQRARSRMDELRRLGGERLLRLRLSKQEEEGRGAVVAASRLPQLLEMLDLTLDEAPLTALDGGPPPENLMARVVEWTATRRGAGEFEGASGAEGIAADGVAGSPGNESTEESSAGLSLSALLFGEWLRFYAPLPLASPPEVFGVSPRRVGDWIAELEDARRVVVDELLMESGEAQICDAENVERLLRIARARARPELQALALDQLPIFTAEHQGLLASGGGIEGLQQSLESLFAFPAPAAAWEQAFLPARLDPYYPAWLDSLLAQGELVWTGCGRRRITFVFGPDLELIAAPDGEQRASEAAVAQPDEGSTAGEGRVAAALDGWLLSAVAPLGERFTFEELRNAARRAPAPVSAASEAELMAALWRQVWGGRLVGDQLFALRRRLAAGPSAAPEASRGGRSVSSSTSRRSRYARGHYAGGHRRQRPDRGGWRSSSPLPGIWHRIPPAPSELDPLAEEEARKDRVRLLLDRYGILFRQRLARELPDFRWRALFRTLRLMELSGELVTGHFFADLPGPQFASPAAVRRLRQSLPQDEAYWMRADDPASPCGLDLEAWKGHFPARRSTTYLAFIGPRLVTVARARGRKLDLQLGPEHPRIEESLRFLSVLLGRSVHPRRSLRIEQINGEPAGSSPYIQVLDRLAECQREGAVLILRRRY